MILLKRWRVAHYRKISPHTQLQAWALQKAGNNKTIAYEAFADRCTAHIYIVYHWFVWYYEFFWNERSV
jgi:hypothetical protein